MVEIAEDLVTYPEQFAYTPGGEKVHIIAGGTADMQLTLCGSYTHQLVLAESPLPAHVLCEWCRAAREKL